MNRLTSRKSHDRKFTRAGSMALFAAALMALTLLAACRERAGDSDEQKSDARKAPAQISVENGQTVLTLDPAAQDRLGIEVTTLAGTATREQVTAPAVVLSAQDLANSRNSCVSAQAQLQKARVQTDVVRKEYTRLKTLFEEDQNISEKALQSSEATLHANETDERAAEQQLSLQDSMARQEWGSAVAKWVVGGSPELERILNQQESLVQVTIPSGTAFGAPQRISLEIPGGGRTEGRLVSEFPRVDPRIQGRSFLYAAAVRQGFAPGMNLVAHLSVGNRMQGVVVPAPAVVWSEGKAWVYQQTAPDAFARRVVETDIPVEEGFFVAQGFSGGEKLVTRGAQALLSEELLLQRGGGQGDEE